MNLITLLQGDLKAISVEAGKKYNSIKQSAEIAVLKLSSMGKLDQAQWIEEIASAEEIIDPIKLSFDSKNQRLLSLGILLIQKLVSANAVSEKNLTVLLTLMSSLTGEKVPEELQVKALSAITTLVSSNQNLHGELLARSLDISFTLHARAAPAVKSTAAHTLPVMISTLFERAVDELKRSSPEPVEVVSTPTKTTEKTTDESESSSHGVSNNQSSSDLGDQQHTTTQAESSSPTTETPPVDEKKPEEPPAPTTSTTTTTTAAAAAATTETAAETPKHTATATSKPAETPKTADTKTTKAPTPSKPTSKMIPAPSSRAVVMNPVVASLQPCARDAFLLTEDICSLMCGDIPSFLHISTLLPTFGLELLDMILSTHHTLFSKMPEFSRLLPDRICQLMIRSFLKISHDYLLAVRLLRLLSTFTVHFASTYISETEVLLIRLSKIMKSEAPIWLHVLVLEVYRQFFSDKPLLSAIYSQCDAKESEETKLYKEMVEAVGHFIQQSFKLDWGQFSIEDGANSRNKCLDKLTVTQPPVISNSYRCYIGLIGLITLTSSLTKLTQTLQAHPDSYKLFSLMVGDAAPVVYNAIGGALKRVHEESFCLQLFKVMEDMVFLLGTYQLIKPRETFVTLLCKACMPASQPEASEKGRPEANKPDLFTFKNIQCIKTLLNIANGMGNILDSSWGLILKTIEQIHLILSSHPAEKDTSHSDIGIIKDSINTIWQTTVNLETSSVCCVIQHLVLLSGQTLKAMTVVDSPESSMPVLNFSLLKLMSVAQLNVGRLDELWDCFCGHIGEITKHKNSGVRSFILTSYLDLVLAAMRHVPSETASDQTPLSAKMQVKFLKTLQELIRSPFPDTHIKALESLLKLIQTAGQMLTNGWQLVLDILGTEAKDSDKFVAKAFANVSLINSDFLPILPAEYLGMYILTIGFYASQTADVNISLTSGDILWNIADSLSQRKAQSEENGVTGTENYRELWVGLFFELKKIVLDERADVRTSGLSTLLKTLTTHGANFPAEIWDPCLSDIVFPTLVAVKELCHTACNKDLTQGTVGAKAQPMLMHHSRDSNQKQWDQTLTQIVSGVNRVFKSMFEQLSLLPKFLEYLERLIEYIESINEHPVSSEVAECTIRELFVIMNKILMEKLPHELWEKSWQVMQNFVKDYSSKGKYLPKNPPVAAVVSCMTALYQECHDLITTLDVIRMMGILKSLIVVDFSEYKDENLLTPIQNASLRLIDLFLKVHEEKDPITEEAVALYCFAVCEYLGIPVASSFVPTTVAKLSPFLQNIGAECIIRVVSLFDTLSPDLQGKVFSLVITTVGSAQRLRNGKRDSILWKPAHTGFLSVAGAGLDSINRMSEFSTDIREVAWTNLAGLIKDFLYPAGYVITAEDKEQDFALFNEYIKIVVTLTSGGHESPVQDLLQLLLQGCHLFSVKVRTTFAQYCYENLFSLCDPEKQPVHVIKIFTPAVIKLCKDVIGAFTQAKPKPHDLSEVEEIMCVLTLLKSLRTEPSAFTPEVSGDTRGILTSHSTTSCSHYHMLELYPCLVACIVATELDVRVAIRDLLQALGEEFLLLACSKATTNTESTTPTTPTSSL
ncbi:MON2 protein [Pelomyxa schiedti]|nr:MON2 protein [Pelomyxa schiedti]